MTQGLRASALVLIVALTGCGGVDSLFQTYEPKSSQEAGEVHLAAGMIAPWDGYVDALQPRFTITPDSALAMALPQTFMARSATYDGLTAGLQLGLPQSALSATTTTATDALGVTTTTGTSTDTVSPGTLPPSALTSRTAADVSALAAPSGALQRDAMLAHTAATAIYQEVQLLNNYLRDAAFKRGYTPYIVRMPVSIQPHARNQPYDVYIDAGFFSVCGADSGIGEPAPVVPLLVTDDVETGQASNTVEMARQLGFSLGAVLHGVAAQASLDRINEQLKSLLGTDTNARFTISRGGAENVVQARIGAQRNPNSDYSMATQNHTVTLIVLVKDRPACASTMHLNVMAASVFRNAKTGKALPSSGQIYSQQVAGLFSRLFSETEMEKALANLGNGATVESLAADLFAVIQTGDALEFAKLVKKAGLSEAYSQILWVNLARVIATSEFATTRFDIPTSAAGVAEADQEQILAAQDDGQQTRLSILGFGNGTGFFRANLKCPNGASIPAISTTRSGVAAPLMVQFPAITPSILKLCGLTQEPVGPAPKPAAGKTQKPAAPAAAPEDDKLKGAVLEVSYRTADPRWADPADTNGQRIVQFDRIYYQAKKKDADTGFSFTAASGTLTADATGSFQLRIFLQKFGTALASVKVEAAGAAIAAIANDSSGKAVAASGLVTLALAPPYASANALPVAIDLKLSGLTPGHVVTLRATATPKAGGGDPVSNSLVLPVVAGAAAPKGG